MKIRMNTKKGLPTIGEGTGVVTKCEYKQTKGGHDIINIVIQDPDDEDYKVRGTIFLNMFFDRYRSFVGAVASILGEDSEDFDLDINDNTGSVDDLIGQTIGYNVAHEEYKGKLDAVITYYFDPANRAEEA